MTIPADLRHKHGFREGDEVDVVEDGHCGVAVSQGEGDVEQAQSPEPAASAAARWSVAEVVIGWLPERSGGRRR